VTSPSTSPSRFFPLGDSAVTIVLGEGASRALSDKVIRVAEAIGVASIEGVSEVVPAYATVAVFYDAIRCDFASMVQSLERVVENVLRSDTTTSSVTGKTIRIPVRYDGEDLDEVATRTGHSRDEVIALHSGRTYHVYMIGFVPGFPYLGELDESLFLPRRPSPRKRVPAGAVAIAEAQSGIYPFSTPGGWHLIGSTDVKMFDPTARNPSLLRAGDKVIFEPSAR
jgi:inhibitor of KinA